MFKTVIFDLDGTLLNTLDDLADAGNRTLATLGYPKHAVEDYKAFVGNGIPKLVERMLPEGHKGVSTQAIALHLFQRYYAEQMDQSTRPYEGVLEVLETLRQHSIQLAVASNKADSFMPSIIEKFFPGYFHTYCGLKEDAPAKPAPDIVEAILLELGAQKETTLFCGDSNVDIQTAKNAQLASCGVLWGFRSQQELENEGATFIAASPSDLLPIILTP